MLIWLDTTDMNADGLTKGAVPRDGQSYTMDGKMSVRHPCENWRSRGPMPASVDNQQFVFH